MAGGIVGAIVVTAVVRRLMRGQSQMIASLLARLFGGIALDGAGIGIPFPIRTLDIPSGSPLERLAASET